MICFTLLSGAALMFSYNYNYKTPCWSVAVFWLESVDFGSLVIAMIVVLVLGIITVVVVVITMIFIIVTVLVVIVADNNGYGCMVEC